jgi:hypothetical protein
MPDAKAHASRVTTANEANSCCHSSPIDARHARHDPLPQGREQGVHWSWREIEGRRCWFKRQGPMPPNSELRWRTKEEVREAVARVEAPPTAAQPQGPSIRMLKAQILWEGISEVAANWIDGDAPVDLMRGDDLSGPAGVGGNWVVPAYRVNAGESTSFAVRFAPVIELRQAGTN